MREVEQVAVERLSLLNCDSCKMVGGLVKQPKG